MAHSEFIDRITRTCGIHGFKDLKLIRKLAEAVAVEIDSQGNTNRIIKEINISIKPPDQAEAAVSIVYKLADIYKRQSADIPNHQQGANLTIHIR